MGTQEDSTLKLFELSNAEKREMAACADRIIDILNGKKRVDTSIDRELTHFVEHLSNIKSFFSKHDRESADEGVHRVTNYVRFWTLGGDYFGDLIKEDLRELLNLNVDYSKVPFKKLEARLKGLGVEGGVRAER